MKVIRKLLLNLKGALPSRCRIFFVYTHKNGFDRFNNGLKANTEISFWSFTALQKEFSSVRFLRFQDEKPSRIASIRPQDIVIGHIGPTFAQAAGRTRKLIAFNPWAGDEDRSKEAFNCAPHEREMHLFDQCASVVLLTSEYNKQKYLLSPTNFWHDYFQRLQKKTSVRVVHQPVDLKQFKRIKWEYSTDGFLYIGNDAYMKCVEDTVALTTALQKKLTTYGFGGRQIDNLNQTQVRALVNQADFFIQPGRWEAQCVSILEAAARGFIPVVSPETGYPYSHPFMLRYNDFAYNLGVLKQLINTSACDRKALADSLYQQLITDIHHNHWGTLTDVLVEEARKLYIQNIEI